MLRDAPAIDEVIPKFWEFVGDHILVGHNAVFDVSFLCLACQTCGRLLKNDSVDTLRLARGLLPELSSYKLSSLAEHFNITNETAHRAGSDALTTVKCLEAMKALVLQTTTISEFRRDFSDPAWKPSVRSLKKLYKPAPDNRGGYPAKHISKQKGSRERLPPSELAYFKVRLIRKYQLSDVYSASLPVSIVYAHFREMSSPYDWKFPSVRDGQCGKKSISCLRECRLPGSDSYALIHSTR